MTTTTDMMRVHILLHGWRFGTTARGDPAIWRPGLGSCVTSLWETRKHRRRYKQEMRAAMVNVPYTETEPAYVAFPVLRALYQFVCKYDVTSYG